MTVTIRRARSDDADFLVDLVRHEDVEPFLAAMRAKGRDEILEEIARSDSDPQAFGVFLIEVEGERAGFTREGVRRRAYWRDDEWVDGVLYGLVSEDLDATG